ncbi:hypothetical protein A1OE_1395 [Candidatus Endolissoclinum faulkneri L2]|uniref:Uncharacterized protein n=1 Tax=Candidatus Endolissoclinum faulkneri L2 TaxID=1193729 RepID=K7YSP3_9PROT|nr:hypothetical protein A1OE_1395 [Candidatus Endolissoclinum faulkneri L2]
MVILLILDITPEQFLMLWLNCFRIKPIDNLRFRMLISF